MITLNWGPCDIVRLLALNIADMSANDNIMILSDSLSCLQSIKNKKLTHPLLIKIVTFTHHQLIVDWKQIAFMWLPSHASLDGNVSADVPA